MIFSPIIPIWILIVLYLLSLVFFSGRKMKRILLITIIFALLLLINLRFKSSAVEVKSSSSNLDILFVIDKTISMVAEDYNGKERRLDAIIEDCDNIISELAGGKYGLIVFDTNARVVAPYTTDGNLVKNFLKTMSVPISSYAKGTDMNAPIDLMYDILTNYKSENDRKKIMFFISDGEITNGESVKSYAKMKGLVDYGAVLGYGTATGGNMKTIEYAYVSKEPEYVVDKTQGYPQKLAVSKIDEGNLKKIANDMGLEYIHMTSHNDADKLIEKLKEMATFEESEEVTEMYSDTYFYYAIPLLFVLAFVFIKTKSKI